MTCPVLSPPQLDYSSEDVHPEMASFAPGYSRLHEPTSRGDQNVIEILILRERIHKITTSQLRKEIKNIYRYVALQMNVPLIYLNFVMAIIFILNQNTKI